MHGFVNDIRSPKGMLWRLGYFPKEIASLCRRSPFGPKPSEVLVPLATSPSTTSTPVAPFSESSVEVEGNNGRVRWSFMAGLFVHRWPTSCQGANVGPITSNNFVLRPPARGASRHFLRSAD